MTDGTGFIYKRGGLYLFKGMILGHRWVVEYLRFYIVKKVVRYRFRVLASTAEADMGRQDFECKDISEGGLKNHTVRAVDFKELPLFMFMEFKYARYRERLARGR